MTDITPRIFISYSWSCSDFVLDLAKKLTADGVYVVIDQWEVREGHDLNAFMESMVTDPSIDKVLVVSNAQYTEKSNSLKGGVGTESQIIRPNIYNQARQDKFVPLVIEKNIDGSPCLPVYLEGRLYIDFSESSKAAVEYERLLRNIYGKPSETRPPIGKPPEFSDKRLERIPAFNDALSNAAIDSENQFVPIYSTKHKVPGGNEWWNGLVNKASSRFYLIGYSNKSWVSKSSEQSNYLAEGIVRIAKNGGLVKIVSNSRAEIMVANCKFLSKYVGTRLQAEQREVATELASRITYHSSENTNYNAVVSDDFLVMMPVLNTLEFRDESMVFTIDRNNAPQPFANYLGDIERLISKSEAIRWIEE